MDLNEYQRLANLTDQRPAPAAGDEDEDDHGALVYPLVGMASEVGSLLTQYKRRVRDRDAHELFSERVGEELGDILWYLANLATKMNLSLEQVATRNLDRVNERWPTEGATVPEKLLDDGFPKSEQLPRRASVRFAAVEIDGKMKVQIRSEGDQLGNDLTDMNYADDGYRFHDAFHLTYAALLGWSPVSRSFFKTKRASDPRVREIEDGGRAVVIEEAISAYVFEYAQHAAFLDGVTTLDYELLRTIKGMCSHLEVRARTSAEWQAAILRSFDIWRALRDNAGGIVHLDLSARTIDFEAG
ncbi:MAG TPA: nucleoside triphosphate pyrophosphohydrolase family protein [Solirubrobacteraceae bacterium]|nr:nucleoside triphosphate pyrophosphohydrolase family protein [Solirubrobacteraceae bacterium]